MPKIAKKNELYATTLRLPKRVYECAKQVVNSGNAQADSFNDFVVNAIRERLRILHEQEIDAAISEIANDAEYQKSAVMMAREFERSDWDAFRTEAESTERPAEAERTSFPKTRQRRRF
jgi:hypothetical protein